MDAGVVSRIENVKYEITHCASAVLQFVHSSAFGLGTIPSLTYVRPLVFDLGLIPRFRKQQQLVLALREPPELSLPRALQRSLNAIEGAHEPSALQSNLARRGKWALWASCFSVVRGLILKSGAIALASATAAGCSTLLAIRILDVAVPLNQKYWLALGFLASNLLSALCTFGGSRLRASISMTIETHLVALVAGKLSRLSAVAASRQTSGNLKTLITSDVKAVGAFFDNMVRNFVPSLGALAVCGPLLAHFAGLAGLLGIAVMALLIPFALALSAVNVRLQDRMQSRLDSLTTLAGEWVKNVRLIRYLSWDESFASDLGVRLRAFLRVGSQQHLLMCLLFGFSTTWWMLSVVGVLLAAHGLGQPLDLPAFFGSLWLLTFLARYFTFLPNDIRLLAEALPCAARISRLLREQEQNDLLAPGEELAPSLRPVALRLEKVSFRYPGTPSTENPLLALADLNVRILLSQKLAVVGAVASGKTTLLRLLCGELPPTEGKIWVEFDDGSTRDLWSQPAHRALRSQLGYVPQEPFVSSDRLSGNITLHPATPPVLGAGTLESETLDAAYWAELQADIGQFSDGLEQEIGEGGVNLSGGQRQRLNLARARFSRRPFLLLDDTLSAVDTRTERLLMDRLTSLDGGFVLVTHRTGELMRVERVIVLEQARIVEDGAPAALAARADSHLTRVLQAYETEGSTA